MFSPPHKQTASDHKLKGRNKSPHGNRDPASKSLARCLDKKQIFLSVAIQDTLRAYPDTRGAPIFLSDPCQFLRNFYFM